MHLVVMYLSEKLSEMKSIIQILALALIVVPAFSQRVVDETYAVDNQKELSLEFPYATSIDLDYWDKNEINVNVEVQINEGEDDELFNLRSRKSDGIIRIFTDKDMFEKADKKRNCWNSDIKYVVRLPRNMEISVETISGDINTTFQGNPLWFKTISGDIELKVDAKKGAQLKAKTISGEIYSNVDIDYLDGKEGLRQIVGMKVRGDIYNGGVSLDLETISGDIFLRKI
jgi:hypothetical protein